MSIQFFEMKTDQAGSAGPKIDNTGPKFAQTGPHKPQSYLFKAQPTNHDSNQQRPQGTEHRRTEESKIEALSARFGCAKQLNDFALLLHASFPTIACIPVLCQYLSFCDFALGQ